MLAHSRHGPALSQSPVDWRAETRPSKVPLSINIIRRVRDGLAWRLDPIWQRTFHGAIHRDRAWVPLLMLLAQRLQTGGQGKLARVPFEWLDTTRHGSRHELLPPGRGLSVGPYVDGQQRIEQVTLPALTLFEFRDAKVGATSSAVLLRGGLILERIPSADSTRGLFAAGFVLGHGRRTAVVRQLPTESLEAGFFLGGNGSFNYYHWLIELLPKLEHLVDRELPLLVSEDVLRIASFQTALSLVAGQRQVIPLRKGRLYRVARLLHINSPILCPFNLKPGYAVEVADFVTRPSALAFLRRRLMTGLDVPEGAERTRLFMGRKSHRRSYNQDQIFAVFVRHGFRMVFMEELSLIEQRQAVANAEMIAGPTGAAWTNLIFARPATRCLCWMAEPMAGFAGFSNLAHHLGVTLQYVTYTSTGQTTDELYQMDYWLDPATVEHAMQRILAA